MVGRPGDPMTEAPSSVVRWPPPTSLILLADFFSVAPGTLTAFAPETPTHPVEIIGQIADVRFVDPDRSDKLLLTLNETRSDHVLTGWGASVFVSRSSAAADVLRKLSRGAIVRARGVVSRGTFSQWADMRDVDWIRAAGARTSRRPEPRTAAESLR